MPRVRQASEQVPEPLQGRQPVRPQPHSIKEGLLRLHQRQPHQGRKGQQKIHPHSRPSGQHSRPLLAHDLGAEQQSRDNAEQADREEAGEVLSVLAAEDGAGIRDEHGKCGTDARVPRATGPLLLSSENFEIDGDGDEGIQGDSAVSLYDVAGFRGAFVADGLPRVFEEGEGGGGARGGRRACCRALLGGDREIGHVLFSRLVLSACTFELKGLLDEYAGFCRNVCITKHYVSQPNVLY